MTALAKSTPHFHFWLPPASKKMDATPTKNAKRLLETAVTPGSGKKSKKIQCSARQYSSAELYQCPACREVVAEKDMNAHGCADNLKNAIGGLVFYCCGAPLRNYPEGMKKLYFKKEKEFPVPRYAVESFHMASSGPAQSVVSHFGSALAAAFLRADSQNDARLASAFPEYKAVYEAFMKDSEELFSSYNIKPMNAEEEDQTEISDN